MKISYIVPSYNHSLFIVQALDSIKKDIFCDYEIIIIDDGSTDNSEQVIKAWIEINKDLKVSFYKQPNSGVCYTINKLLSLSQGDFIRLVGSDDEIIQGSTQILIRALQESPDKLVAFGDTQTIDDQGQIIALSHLEFLGRDKQLYKTDLKKAIISQWGIAGPVLVYRQGFIKQVGPYDESIVIEDWNMYLRLAGLEKLIFVDSVVAKYRIHTTNTSRTTDVNKRIRNLESQYIGGMKNINFFSGRYSSALKAQLYLLQAKLSYLNKNFFHCAVNLFKYKINQLK